MASRASDIDSRRFQERFGGASSFVRRAVALVLAASFAVAPIAQAQLPTLGDTSDMTASVERKLGERIARELYRDPDYIDDPVLDEYVQSLWKRLLVAARARGELTAELDERFAWQVLLGKDRSINAFALPKWQQDGLRDNLPRQDARKELRDRLYRSKLDSERLYTLVYLATGDEDVALQAQADFERSRPAT